MTARHISEQEAIARYGIRDHDPIGFFGYRQVLVFDGDVAVPGHVDSTWYARHLAELDVRRTEPALVIVDGDLTASGDVALVREPSISLLVRGALSCDVLEGDYHQNILVMGDATIRCAVLAIRQDAALYIEGATHVPFVFNNGDHALRLRHDERQRPNYIHSRDELGPIAQRLGIRLEADDEEPHYTVIEWLRTRAGALPPSEAGQ